MDANSRKKELFRAGLVVFFLLAILTIGEFMLGAIAVGWAAPLFGIAFLKAALILRDYMHLPRLFAGDEESH
jgi:TM2 domain-containing membrane protein YozV